MRGLLCTLGVDLGTSGVRVCVVEKQDGLRIVGEASTRWSDADGAKPETWLEALRETLVACDGVERASRIAVSGTSASLLAVDNGRVSRGPLMYDAAVAGPSGDWAVSAIDALAPEGHVTRSRTSALAKLLSWHHAEPLKATEVAAHQADYVSAKLAGSSQVSSDWHNALKLGFDVGALEWPAWLLDALDAHGVPPSCVSSLRVARPGSETHVVSDEAAREWGLMPGARLVAGTTDSIAAYLACSTDLDDARVDLSPGSAVTSLGSTTALKLVSDVRVDDASLGVYSHRIDDTWLVGGASNAGCRVLRAFGFDDNELSVLSQRLHVDETPQNAAGVYPLVDKGERFPVNDPDKAPVLPPKDTDDRLSLLNLLLLGIADVEATGYRALASLGATELTSVKTAGGGAKNDNWRRIRHRMLGVPVRQATNTDAAFGAAVLALGK